MSMEAQFYEAKRRQRVIERSQSLRAKDEIVKQAQQPEYRSFIIPRRSARPAGQSNRCTCTPMDLFLLTDFDKISFDRERNIYPRPKTTATSRAPVRAPVARAQQQSFRNARLPNRFTSTEYRQQW